MPPRRARVSLTGQVALLSLIPIVALGFVLAWVLRGQIVDRTLADASQSASLVARLGVQPRISRYELEHGLSPSGVQALDEQLKARSVTRDLARIKIWNNKGLIVYSDDHALIGRRPGESDDLESALRGRPEAATVVTPTRDSETASEVGLGRLVEVYVPLRFAASERPAGAFEIYLSYAPIATAIGSDERMIAVLVALGLALLWGILFRIVASASKRLSRQAEENDRLARYDQLTGLPNRTLFSERLVETLRENRPAGDEIAVLLLDLDGFKQINDTLGHGAGDTVLIEVGQRLRASLDEDFVIARLGNDEYALLQPHSKGQAGALETAARVRRTMEEPVALEGVSVNVETSIGIALAPDHATDAETLLRRADMALAHARTYRGVVEVYSAEHDHFDTARLKLLGQVRPALEREEFVLFYQPKIDLTTSRVVGVEALLRWRHPQRGMLAPLEFMPLIEQTALIGSVTRYVIDHALIQLATWRQAGLDLGMSVNLSAFNLSDPSLPAHVESLLKTHSTPERRTHGRGHRERRDGRRRQGVARTACFEWIGSGDLDRRLRQWPCLDRLPHTAPRYRAEDRPLLDYPYLREPARRSDRAHHDRPGAPSRSLRGGRGNRDGRGRRALGSNRLRRGTGLLHLTAFAGGRVCGMVGGQAGFADRSKDIKTSSSSAQQTEEPDKRVELCSW